MPDTPDLEPLFATILEHIPAPSYTEGAPLQAHVTNLDASPYLGRLALVPGASPGDASGKGQTRCLVPYRRHRRARQLSRSC